MLLYNRMSLATAALLAAAGLALQYAASVITTIWFAASQPAQFGFTLATGVHLAAGAALIAVFSFLYTELSGRTAPGRRQDAALFATIGQGALIAVAVSRPIRGGIGRWVVNALLHEIAWLVFLIILTKEPAPFGRRETRITAAVLLLLTAVQTVRNGYNLFFSGALRWYGQWPRVTNDLLVFSLGILLQVFTWATLLLFFTKLSLDVNRKLQ